MSESTPVVDKPSTIPDKPSTIPNTSNQEDPSAFTATSTSLVASSELRALLSTLYNPAEWDDESVLAGSDMRWHLDYLAGLEALRDSSYADAVESFSKALSEAYGASSFLDSVIRYFDWREIFAGILNRRAYALYKLDRFEDALSDINMTCESEVHIKRPETHLLTADIMLELQRYESALDSLGKAFQILLERRPALKRWLTDAEKQIVQVLENLAGEDDEYVGQRLDPMERLPEDIIELIMKHGLDSDEYFALRCTWVSSTWRQTLEALASIWRVYTYNTEAFRTGAEKRKAWARNAGNRFNEIRLVNVNILAALKCINNTWKPLLQNMQILKLQGSTMNNIRVIQRFAQLSSASYNVKALHLESKHDGQLATELDSGLLTPDNRTTIEEIHLLNLDLVTDEASAANDGAGAYTTLRSLSLIQCRIIPRRSSVDVVSTNVIERSTQQDILHVAMRQASQLETLRVTTSSPEGEVLERFKVWPHPRTFAREMMLLSQLRILRIPPPSFWAFDIITPLVRHLAFVLSGIGYLGLEMTQGDWARNGTIPDLTSFAITGIKVDKLVSLELMLNGGDTGESLLEWLKVMECVEKLTIVSVQLWKSSPFEMSPGYSATKSKLGESYLGPDPDNTANRNLIKLLHKDPLLCPRLRNLHLSNMHTPEAPLLAWIIARKAGDMAVSPIDTLELKQCTFISESSNQLLRQELPTFEIVNPRHITRLGWKELCDNWDKSVNMDHFGEWYASSSPDSGTEHHY
ncbi:hypothetical protein QFC21_001562 [Naganishia friedmannii]|uniref:Uncharacterized protein n=1 Tax=Naganishia friedmannii TaxID=89922 RepID=A0ACC2W4R9_9TREE|nr:hypothetical protein QFC21_001562 [Naganishia friedmannii]